MISKETAIDIALAYREAEAGEKLLIEVRKAVDTFNPSDLRDAFGRPARGLQLGIPSGENSHRLLDVSYALAVPVIEAHIAQSRAKIDALCQKAASELVGPTSTERNA